MFCVKCGNQLRENSGFCDRCGAPVTKPPAQTEDGQQPNTPQPAQPGQKKPVMLIVLLILVAIIGILLALLFMNLGKDKDVESSAPFSFSSASPSRPSASSSDSSETQVLSSHSEDEASEQDERDLEEQREREVSEAWKRLIYEWAKKRHAEITFSGTMVYSINLFEYGDGYIGFRFASYVKDMIMSRNDEIFGLQGGAVAGIGESGPMGGLYINPSTGKIEVISTGIRGAVLYQRFEDGVWVAKAISGKDTGVPREESDKILGELLAGLEQAGDLTEYIFSDSWEESAIELSMWLDNYDGIIINLAGEEDSARATAKPQAASTDWAGAYADVVAAIRNNVYYNDGNSVYQNNIIGVYVTSFDLTDIDFNDTPELIITYGGIAGWGRPNVSCIIDLDAARRFPFGASDNQFSFLEEKVKHISASPLRYFRSNTGNTIFSTLAYESAGNKAIVYHRLNADYDIYRTVYCDYYGHVLYDGRAWHNGAEGIVIEKIEINEHDYYACDIERGLNSSDPTIVRLVQRALEGYTEITAPKKYTYEVQPDMSNQYYYDIEAVQDWIYQVAANY